MQDFWSGFENNVQNFGGVDFHNIPNNANGNDDVVTNMDNFYYPNQFDIRMSPEPPKVVSNIQQKEIIFCDNDFMMDIDPFAVQVDVDYMGEFGD